jgi:hypothetical protein
MAHRHDDEYVHRHELDAESHRHRLIEVIEHVHGAHGGDRHGHTHIIMTSAAVRAKDGDAPSTSSPGTFRARAPVVQGRSRPPARRSRASRARAPLAPHRNHRNRADLARLAAARDRRLMLAVAALDAPIHERDLRMARLRCESPGDDGGVQGDHHVGPL